MYIISNIEEVLYKMLRKQHPDWSSEKIDDEINRMGEEFVSNEKTVQAGVIDNVFNKKRRAIRDLLKTLERVSPIYDFKGCYKDTFCDKTCGGCDLAVAINNLTKYDIETIAKMKQAILSENKTEEQIELLEILSSHIS